jgi:hypothetical protein
MNKENRTQRLNVRFTKDEINYLKLLSKTKNFSFNIRQIIFKGVAENLTKQYKPIKTNKHE